MIIKKQIVNYLLTLHYILKSLWIVYIQICYLFSDRSQDSPLTKTPLTRYKDATTWYKDTTTMYKDTTNYQVLALLVLRFLHMQMTNNNITFGK